MSETVNSGTSIIGELRSLADEAATEANLTDLGNSRRFAWYQKEKIRYCYQRKAWLHWNGARWEWDSTGETAAKAKEVVCRIYLEAGKAATKKERSALATHAMRSEATARIRAMLSLAESEPGIPILENQLDQNPWLLNVANGTLELRTGELKPHNARDMHTKIAPVVFDPSATCPLWERFLDEIMNSNSSLISFLQRSAGYSLTGDTREQCLFISYGMGANGKTTYLQTMAALMGDYAQQSPTETLLVRRLGGIPNDLARLKSARFVSAIEVEEGRRLAESLVKALTGCLAWQQDGLGTPEEVKAATDEYRLESDMLSQFLEERTDQDKDAMIKASELYAEYRQWADDNGEKSITGKAFSSALLEKGYDKVRITAGVHYLGLKLGVKNE